MQMAGRNYNISFDDSNKKRYKIITNQYNKSFQMELIPTPLCEAIILRY